MKKISWPRACASSMNTKVVSLSIAICGSGSIRNPILRRRVLIPYPPLGCLGSDPDDGAAGEVVVQRAARSADREQEAQAERERREQVADRADEAAPERQRASV